MLEREGGGDVNDDCNRGGELVPKNQHEGIREPTSGCPLWNAVVPSLLFVITRTLAEGTTMGNVPVFPAPSPFRMLSFRMTPRPFK